MEKLSKLLMQERKYVQAITQLEEKRQNAVEATFEELNITAKEKTVTELLHHARNEEEKIELEKAMTALVEVIVQIKDREQLNSELIAQSMQFVHLSLDLLQPHNQRINYNEKSTGSDTAKQSVFDSKA